MPNPKEILSSLANNPPLLAAVKELLLTQFSLTDIDTTVPNEVMGQIVRARVDGRAAVEKAFKEIERYRSVRAPKEQSNPAR